MKCCFIPIHSCLYRLREVSVPESVCELLYKGVTYALSTFVDPANVLQKVPDNQLFVACVASARKDTAKR